MSWWSDMTCTSELSLHGLGELRILDDGVQRGLCGEDGVKIGNVDRARHTRLERRLDLLLDQPFPVDLLKESVLLDLVCSIHSQTLRWVTRQQSGEDGLCLRTNVVAKDERVMQNLLVHVLCVF